VVEQVGPEEEKELHTHIMKLAELMVRPNGKGAEIASVAQRAADLSDKIAGRLNAQKYDQRFTLQLMRSIAEDGDAIAQQGERSAEQAYMSLDSLFDAYRQNIRQSNDSEIQAAIAGLFQQFNNPSAYNAPRFAAQMQKVQSALVRGASAAGTSK